MLGRDSDDRRQVFDIEHIQSGRRTRIENLSEAQPWMETISAENREVEAEEEIF